MAIASAQTPVKNAVGGGVATTIAATLGSSVTAGNFLCAQATVNGNTTHTYSSPGATWHTIGPIFDAAIGQSISIGYAENVPSGSTTVTCTFGTGNNFRTIIVSEWSGVATSSSLDVSTSGQHNAASLTPADASMTTTANGDLCIGACQTDGATTQVGASGFTEILYDTTNGFGSASAVQSTAGAIAASYTIAPSKQTTTISAAFKAAAGGSFTGSISTALGLTATMAGVVGTSSGATAVLGLAALIDGIVSGSGNYDGSITAELGLSATMDGVVTAIGDVTLAPDRPDWTREDTASIIYIQTKILAPDEVEIFGLSGVGSYTLLAQSAGADVPIFLILSYNATPDLSTPVAVSIATCAASPLAAQSMAYESPSYGGSLGVFNHDPVNPVTVTVYSSNRVVATPRYIGDLLPGRSYRLADVFTPATQLFVPPSDYQTFGYCANVDTGFCATSTDAGVLYYAYLDGVSAPQQIPIMTLAANVPQLAQLPLPQSMGQFYFTPATPNPAGVLTLLAYPARS